MMNHLLNEQDAVMTTTAIKLYGVSLSGHCHRVELMLRMLDLPFEYIQAGADVRATPDFLQLNPLGKIPVLVDGDLVIADSNAILVYLAKRYAANSGWLPEDAVEAAHVQRWLSIAAGELRHGPASARMTVLWNMKGEVDLALANAISTRLLRMMDAHLANRQYLATAQPTIADLACYSYIAHAHEGRISLSPYPAITAWLQRIENLPQFVPMPASAIPEAA
jgi:glutathione S-transferase